MCVFYYICNVGQWPLCMNKLFDLTTTTSTIYNKENKYYVYI